MSKHNDGCEPDGCEQSCPQVANGQFPATMFFSDVIGLRDEHNGAVAYGAMLGVRGVGAEIARRWNAHDALTAERDALRLALETTTTMLEFEAKSHEESGDEKRKRYVAPIRGQVALARKALALSRPVAP
jgi:hypothetical protein